MTSQFLSKFCIPLQLLEILFLCTFLTQTIYTLLIKSPLKWKSLRLSRAQVKICQTPYANFEMTSRFLSKFCIPLQLHEILFLCTFLTQTIHTLLKRSPLKWKLLRLRVPRSKFVKFLMPILKRQVDSAPSFVYPFSFMKDNSSIPF